MADREKVLKGLQELTQFLFDEYKEAMTKQEIAENYDRFLVANDALNLLKEQETIFLRDGHHVRCMYCGEYWCDSDREGNPFSMNFCPNCGKAVKWE